MTEVKPDGVHLNWTTRSETDNLGFIPERNAGAAGRYPLGWNTIASYETCVDLMGKGIFSAKHDYSFVDSDVDAGQTYTYRLSDVNTEGGTHVYDIIHLTLTDTPEMTAIHPPFPNPFNPETKINYTLVVAGRINITIYDLPGRRVKTLLAVCRT